MIRVNIFVEGQTEETFVRDVLAPAFAYQQIYFTPILAQTSRGYKGGIVSYGKVKHQIERLCKQDPQAWVTTMIDYYGLPTDFPGLDENPAQHADIYVRIARLEQAFKQDINLPNFLANFIVHEYEALLFCQPEKFIDWIDDETPVKKLLAMKAEFPTPEQINNSPQTAPSKRILATIPTYKKTLHGPLIAADIGLDSMRQQCPHFHSWLQRIEALAD
ncbi:DUF4276 family protein [Dickeya dadantii]|nr:DUF4276 family protein [Dickeya dadantii]NPE60936.1 DUF4276 family protein [Dickeya dadantii]NPE70281.1 DUF4276 family protein [Dickeya dadantii]OOC15327.1 hypothetical protein BM451_01515 [Dickeya dadantii]